MAKRKATPDIALPIVALLGLLLAGPHHAEAPLSRGFEEFARICLIFTAVAVASHQLKSAKALRYAGLWLGEKIGYVVKSRLLLLVLDMLD